MPGWNATRMLASAESVCTRLTFAIEGPVHSLATAMTRFWSAGSPSMNRTVTGAPWGHL